MLAAKLCYNWLMEAISSRPNDSFKLESLGKPIASGRTAEIYAWPNGQVVKLFHAGSPASAVDHEATVARQVHASGLRGAAVGEVVDIDGRHGLVYERVEGPSALQTLRTHLWQSSQLMRMMAQLHVTMHDQHIPALPEQRQRLSRKIQSVDSLPKA